MSAPNALDAPPPELAIRTFIDTLPAGTRILDVGAGRGTFPYEAYPALRVAAVDLLRPAEPSAGFSKASADHLPFRDQQFDVLIAHWLFEHVDHLERTMNEVRRVLRPGGVMLVAVPNSHSFEDRSYRFVSYVYKYAFLHFSKRVEHVQIITFLNLNQRLYGRGFRLLRFREEEAGYCWLAIDQLRPFRAPFMAMLRFMKAIGIDLFKSANYRLIYRLESGEGIDGQYLAMDLERGP